MDSMRLPMDNLFNMLSSFSAGHEKALKQGIYNALALFLLCLISVAGYGLYIILSPFVKPLIWALLCGSALFPFKYSLTTVVHSWFEKAEKSHTPLIINLTLLPLQIVDKVSDNLGSFLWSRIKYIAIAILLAASSFGLYHYTPNILSCLVWRICVIFNSIIGFYITTCNIYTISILLIGYLSILYIYWTPTNSINFHYASFVVWFCISLYVSNIFGAYQVLIFILLGALCLMGFIYEVILIMESQELEDKHMTFMEATRFALTNNLVASTQDDVIVPLKTKQSTENIGSETIIADASSKDNNEETTRPLSAPVTAASGYNTKLYRKSMSLDADDGAALSSHKYQSASNNRYLLRRLKTELKISIDMENNKVDTDKYMYGALYACIGMLLWKHKWMICILIIPTVFYIIKQLGNYFGLWKMLANQYNIIIQVIMTWCMQRHQALLPANIRGLYKIIIIIDEKLTKALKASVDTVATAAVIFGLLVFTICASIFITIQVYIEGMHLIQITGEILNSSLNNPDIDWLPEQWEDSVSNVLSNAYTYGRSAISDGVKGIVKDLDATKAEQMEKKVLELWDTLYYWMISNDNTDIVGSSVDVAGAYSIWESFSESFGKMPLQIFNMSSIQNFIKENIGLLKSVLDSIWSIVKGNMSVILTIFTELFYIVLMSGTAVFNFALSMVVFFTTLFYLLSSSNKTYKPIELTTLFSPISCHSLYVEGFAVALQEAVIGVFAATFKLASFFGMWTWFIHNMFQVKIVYLPSAFATILGAVPFLDAYFACIPATLELWFTRGYMVAILFFMFHFLPCNIVVTEFYKEIKGGGHPYLTGLSIAGGVFCLGVEGAIFGPLLLCCIMVAINLSRRYLHSPSEETIPEYSEIKH
ncbi:transmembrane protein 245 isoform X1 [Nomia melanderi]|uniref:transmembrane protein 245 isoform X1 n=1 Tax=Nomia melanderi TaxID=2448451 RepID=UPI003FCEC7F9